MCYSNFDIKRFYQIKKKEEKKKAFLIFFLKKKKNKSYVYQIVCACKHDLAEVIF